MGFNVQFILVDKENSMNMMYWDAFIGLKVPKDPMLPRPKVLVGFAEAEAEVRGYVLAQLLVMQWSKCS